MIVTKEKITAALNRDDREFVSQYVGRALVALFGRQLVAERQDNTTKVHNMVGFSGPDARTGSLGAKYFLKHHKLEDWQIEQWTRDWRGAPRLAKYWKQLNEIAEEKRNG